MSSNRHGLCNLVEKILITNEKMKHLIVVVVGILTVTSVQGQKISSLDIVRIDSRFEREALYYNEQNWKEFRVAALREGHISGFNLLRTAVDSTSNFNLILITEYPDSARFNSREDNFRPIMKRISPSGPKLLNDASPRSFIQYLFGVDALSIHGSREK